MQTDNIQIPGFLKRDNGITLDCEVKLDSFEGPLDLLLYLIKTHELDIINLPVAAITKQYLQYLNYMRDMNLDLASEYLVMAATLTFIKSQSVLPQEVKDEAMGPDPRAQLIRRLVELKCYKQIANHMEQRPRLFRDVFLAKNTGADEIQDSIEPELALSNPFQLVEGYKALMERRKVVEHKVYDDDVPINYCMEQIVNRFRSEDSVTFQSLLPKLSKPHHVVSMFLGTLEMARLQVASIDQKEIFGPISLIRKLSLEQIEEAIELVHQVKWEHAETTKPLPHKE